MENELEMDGKQKSDNRESYWPENDGIEVRNQVEL